MRTRSTYQLLFYIAAMLLWYGCAPRHKAYDTTVTLKATDKNPYGAYVFYESIKQFYQKQELESVRRTINTSYAMYDTTGNSLMVSLNQRFEPSDTDWEEIVAFVKAGNTAFISTFVLDTDILDALGANTGYYGLEYLPNTDFSADSLVVHLSKIIKEGDTTFAYPGADLSTYFYKHSDSIGRVLGYTKQGRANLLQAKIGEGNFFVHVAPMAFTNYFLLYENNHQYFEHVFSNVVNARGNTAFNKIFIDDYFYKSAKTHQREDNKNWLDNIMQYRSFKAAIITAVLLLLVYIVLQMRRRQKAIPVIAPLKNDSLDFVKTVGLMYYDARDNVNLAHKMSTYFLEHVRSRYKLFAPHLNPELIEELSFKSGVSKVLVRKIINQINELNSTGSIGETDLITFQNDIEDFYKQA